MTRLLVIGDVHGCLIELENLLRKLQYEVHQDTLVFVGDLLNKGPSGAETLSFVNDLIDDGGEVIYVRGNHDEKYLKFYNQFSKRLCRGEKPQRRLCQGWLGPDGWNPERTFSTFSRSRGAHAPTAPTKAPRALRGAREPRGCGKRAGNPLWIQAIWS